VLSCCFMVINSCAKKEVDDAPLIETTPRSLGLWSWEGMEYGFPRLIDLNLTRDNCEWYLYSIHPSIPPSITNASFNPSISNT